MGLITGYSIFTKPWKQEKPEELGKIVKGLGFDSIEYPLREGYQADLASAKTSLKALAGVLESMGVGIASVASTTDEYVFEACAEAKVPLIRIMMNMDLNKGYMESEKAMKKDIERFLPLCERYGVKVGVQQHYGAMINNSMEMRHLVEGYDPKYVGGIWDAAHSSLAGEEPEQALDIIWDYLALINFKAGYYRRMNGPEAEKAMFKPHFTTGPNGIFPWSRAVNFIVKKGYKGIINMPAEYTDGANVIPYIKEDLPFLKNLFKEAEANKQ